MVRHIYFRFMAGETFNGIANGLNKDGIATPSGKGKWGATTIMSILRNEKYKGDALLQKSFAVDFLEHKSKRNEGEVTQYYVRDSHPAIIPKEDWELIQIELARRKALRCSYSKRNPFLGKLVCEDCGGQYGRKVWHSNDPAKRKEVVQCNDKFTKGCKSPTLTEDDVKQRVVKAYDSMLLDKEETISGIELVKKRITDTSDIDGKIAKLDDEMDRLAKAIEALVRENTRTPKDQETWKRRYAELEASYKAKASELNDLTLKRKEKSLKASRIDSFVSLLRKGEALTKWDEVIFNLTLEKAVVHKDRSITFVFLSGNEVTVEG